MLQYITDNTSRRSVEDQVKEVLDAGCDWIQVSTDGQSDDKIKELIEKIIPECIERKSFLIFRDRMELAKELNVGGIVVSQGSILPAQARVFLGTAAVVGVEAYNSDQITAVRSLDIDYIALRPFKEIPDCTIEPLGLAGIKSICDFMDSKEILIPRVATGGVTYEDIAPLMDAGCNGVAMSEALANAKDIADATAKALTLLKVYEQKELDKIN